MRKNGFKCLKNVGKNHQNVVLTESSEADRPMKVGENTIIGYRLPQ